MYYSVYITIYTVGNRSLINMGNYRLITTARDGVYYSRDNSGGVGLCGALAEQAAQMFHVEQNRADFEHIIAQLCNTAHLKRLADAGVKRRKYRVIFYAGEIHVDEMRC